ncbi:hypothetical protein TGMAS_313770 [Toxoplasma gondii MAS]|uniref:Uncharacterized protein n=1 Tax=Toxoplasma gondii MAS TaxID=943118 RepID=A0A086QYR2_TOXGO|nr:hypothetical protein TGMAS_313770 [Toxoplasma gondii MAS]
MFAPGHLRLPAASPPGPALWRTASQGSRRLENKDRAVPSDPGVPHRRVNGAKKRSGGFSSPSQTSGVQTPRSPLTTDLKFLSFGRRASSFSSHSLFPFTSSPFLRSSTSPSSSLLPNGPHLKPLYQLPLRGFSSSFPRGDPPSLSHDAASSAFSVQEQALRRGSGNAASFPEFREGPESFAFLGRSTSTLQGVEDGRDGRPSEPAERELYATLLAHYRNLLYCLPPMGAGGEREQQTQDEGEQPVMGSEERQKVIEFLVASEEGIRLCSSRGFVDIAALPVLRLALPPSLLSYLARTFVQVALASPSLLPFRICLENCRSNMQENDPEQAASRLSSSPLPSLSTIPASFSPSEMEELRRASQQVERAWGLPRFTTFYVTVCTLEQRGVLRDVPGASELRHVSTLGLLSLLKNEEQTPTLSLAQLLPALAITPQTVGQRHTSELESVLQETLGRRLTEEFPASFPQASVEQRSEHLLVRLELLSRSLRVALDRNALHSSLLSALKEAVTCVTRELDAERRRLHRCLSGDETVQEHASSLCARVGKQAAVLPSLANCVLASERLHQKLAVSTTPEAKKKNETLSQGEQSGEASTPRREGDGGQLREVQVNLQRSFVAFQTEILEAARLVLADGHLRQNGFSQQLVRCLKKPLQAVVYLQQNAGKAEATDGSPAHHRSLNEYATERPERFLDALAGPLVEFLGCMYTYATAQVTPSLTEGSERTPMSSRAGLYLSAVGPEPQGERTRGLSVLSETREGLHNAFTPPRPQTAYPHVPPDSPFAFVATSHLSESESASSSPQANESASLPFSFSPVVTTNLQGEASPNKHGDPEFARAPVVGRRQRESMRRLLDELLEEGGVVQLATVLLRGSEKARRKLFGVLLPLLPELPNPCLLQLLKIVSQVALLPSLPEPSLHASGPPTRSLDSAESSPGASVAGQLAARLLQEGEKKGGEEEIQGPIGAEGTESGRQRQGVESGSTLQLGGELKRGVQTPGAGSQVKDESADGDFGGFGSHERDTEAFPRHLSETREMTLFDAIVDEVERRRRCGGSDLKIHKSGDAPDEDWMSFDDLVLLSACFRRKEIAKELRNPSSLLFFSDRLPSLAAEKLQALLQAPEENKKAGEHAALLVARVTQAVEAVHLHSACVAAVATASPTGDRRMSSSRGEDSVAEAAAFADSVSPSRGLASLEMSRFFQVVAGICSSLRDVPPASLTLLLAAFSRGTGAHSQALKQLAENRLGPETSVAETTEQMEDALRIWKAHAEVHNAVSKSLLESQNVSTLSTGQTRLFLLSFLGLLQLRDLFVSPVDQKRGNAFPHQPSRKDQEFASLFLQDQRAGELWIEFQETLDAILRQILAGLGSKVRSGCPDSDEDIAETLHLINSISRFSPRAADLLEAVGLPLGPQTPPGSERNLSQLNGVSRRPDASLRERRARLKAFFQAPGTVGASGAADLSISGKDRVSSSADASATLRGFLSRWLGRGR